MATWVRRSFKLCQQWRSKNWKQSKLKSHECLLIIKVWGSKLLFCSSHLLCSPWKLMGLSKRKGREVFTRDCNSIAMIWLWTHACKSCWWPTPPRALCLLHKYMSLLSLRRKTLIWRRKDTTFQNWIPLSRFSIARISILPSWRSWPKTLICECRESLTFQWRTQGWGQHPAAFCCHMSCFTICFTMRKDGRAQSYLTKDCFANFGIVSKSTQPWLHIRFWQGRTIRIIAFPYLCMVMKHPSLGWAKYGAAKHCCSLGAVWLP